MATKKTGSPAKATKGRAKPKPKPLPKTTKRGPLSNAERGTIMSLAGKKSAEQIATSLNRPLSTIIDYLEAIDVEEPKDNGLTLQQELRQRPEWKSFQRQFSPQELEFFSYRYVQLMDQFGREDVTHTEERQIFNLITVELLIDRNLEEQKVNHDVMVALQGELDVRTKQPDKTEEEMEMLLEIQTQYDNARAGAQSANVRWKDLSAKQSQIFKELKATRDQRVKVNENPANSFLGLLKQLNQAEFARRAGREAEMMRRAADAEKQRLIQPHRYEDGMVDQPILTAETLIDDYDRDSVRALPAPDQRPNEDGDELGQAADEPAE
jgi:hypothetical protein